MRERKVWVWRDMDMLLKGKEGEGDGRIRIPEILEKRGKDGFSHLWTMFEEEVLKIPKGQKDVDGVVDKEKERYVNIGELKSDEEFHRWYEFFESKVKWNKRRQESAEIVFSVLVIQNKSQEWSEKEKKIEFVDWKGNIFF